MDHSGILQDNKSTILLTQNGTMSSPKKTKHIKHNLFLVKEKIYGGNIEIQYKPTGSIWCDILTKHKQDSDFRKLRVHLINTPKEYDDEAECLLTHPNLLPEGDIPDMLSKTDQAVLMQYFRKKDDKKRRFLLLIMYILNRNRLREMQRTQQRDQQRICCNNK